MIIDDILAYNRRFVEAKGYEPYITDKFPAKGVAILTCMDTRLTTLLPAALGLRNGDAKVIKNAGGLVSDPYGSAMRSLLVGIYELGVTHIMVVAHSDCGACHLDGHHMKHLMQDRGISAETIRQAEQESGVDIETWLEGFHDTPRSVRQTVDTIRRHPLVPADTVVRGFVIDSVTGRLTPID